MTVLAPANLEEKATSEDIRNCFRLILGREPHQEELAGHFSRVGEPLNNVVFSYLNSAEFADRNLLKDEKPKNVHSVRFDGFVIFADANDAAVGRHVAAKVYEPEIETVFRRFINPGMTVVDIGANIGFFTMLSRSIVGAGGHVLAVEPNVENVRLIEASRRSNNFGNVEVLCTAASDRIGVLSLHTEYSNGSVKEASGFDQLWSSKLVPAIPLDSVLSSRKVDFIKIDVEGNEASALRGSADAIRRSKPIIVSEFSATGIVGGPDAYLDFLLSHGYALGVIQKSGEVADYGREKSKVIEAFFKNGTDHIDIIAAPQGLL